jgi:hypothetical protein
MLPGIIGAIRLIQEVDNNHIVFMQIFGPRVIQETFYSIPIALIWHNDGTTQCASSARKALVLKHMLHLLDAVNQTNSRSSLYINHPYLQNTSLPDQPLTYAKPWLPLSASPPPVSTRYPFLTA